ncbi:MAG: Crp/Fnr family transcriptional regulator [Nitrospinota bacterium]
MSKTLTHVKIFDQISIFDQGLIKKKSTIVSLKKGTPLLYREESANYIFVIESGMLQVSIDSKSGKEIIVYKLLEGDIVGELNLFSNKERTATAIALNDSKLIKISNTDFIEFMRTFPQIGLNLTNVLIERLISANRTIERLGAMDATDRVADFIYSLAKIEGKEQDDYFHIQKRPTYINISQELAISEKTVFRVFKALEADGKIEMIGRELKVYKSIMDDES